MKNKSKFYPYLKMKIGTKEKPIKASQDKGIRPLIEQYAKPNFKFKDVHKDGNDYFLLNVIGNPYLSSSAMKVALYFYQYFIIDEVQPYDWQCGDVFAITDADVSHLDEYANVLLSWVDYDGQLLSYESSECSLVGKLNRANIFISASNLMKALRELHEFHYITLSPAPNELKTTQEDTGSRLKKKQRRQPVRHIRLYQGMIDKPFLSYLKEKKKVCRVKKSERKGGENK